jgi:hypothetical protein
MELNNWKIITSYFLEYVWPHIVSFSKPYLQQNLLFKISHRYDLPSNNFKIELPSQLESFEFISNGLETDLGFLMNIVNLKSLKLKTDVYNGGKGFKNFEEI